MTRVGAALIAALTLLTFAAPHVHQVVNHFRTPEVRNSIERHTFLNDTRADCAGQVAIEEDWLNPLIAFDSDLPTLEIERPAPVAALRSSRLLLRLKLRARSKRSPDPFI